MSVIAAMGPAKTYFCTFVNVQEIFPVFVKNSHCGEGEYSRKQQAAGKGHIGRDNQHRSYRAHHYIVAYQSDQYYYQQNYQGESLVEGQGHSQVRGKALAPLKS